ESPGPEKLLLQSPEESLNAAVPFRRANERRARGDAEEAQLILEVVADVLASVVMANNEASGDLLGVDAEPLTDALPNRLECLETRGSPGRMDTHALCSAMIHCREDRDRAFFECLDAGRIGAPHLVGSVRDNRPVVNTGPKHSTWPRGSKEAVLPHDPEDPTLARANAFPAQSRPGLSVSLAVERRFGQDAADLPDEVGVGVGSFGPTLFWQGEGQFELRPGSIQGRAGHLELIGDSSHAIASFGGRRDGVAQSLDFRQGKGDSDSRARALSLASSSLIVRSPTRAFSLMTSSSAAVLSRVFNPAWPAAKNSSRHRESVAAVTPSSRESSSR